MIVLWLLHLLRLDIKGGHSTVVLFNFFVIYVLPNFTFVFAACLHLVRGEHREGLDGAD